MPDEIEYSEGGFPIYKYNDNAPDSTQSQMDDHAIARIEAHIQRHVGSYDTVFHELVSEYVHIDVHIIQPTPQRNYFSLITTGMSDRPMNVPPGAEDRRYAELMICLPPTWPLDEHNIRDEANYWPLRWLKFLARLPHQYDTWLGAAHTIPNDDPPRRFASNTRLCCAMVFVPVLFDERFSPLVINQDKAIHFYTVIPIYQEEMDFKLKYGAKALYDRLEASHVTELLDIRRPNTCL